MINSARQVLAKVISEYMAVNDKKPVSLDSLNKIFSYLTSKKHEVYTCNSDVIPVRLLDDIKYMKNITFEIEEVEKEKYSITYFGITSKKLPDEELEALIKEAVKKF